MNPFFAFLSDNLASALGWTLLHSLWQITVIGLLNALVLMLLRRKTAALRYRITGLAMLTIPAVALITFCLYYNDSPNVWRFEQGSITQQIEGNTPTLPSPDAGAQTAPIMPETSSETTQMGFGARMQAYFEPHLPLIACLWLLGVSFFLLRLVGQMGRLYYLKNRMNFPVDEYWTELTERLSAKAGLTKAVEVVESALVRSPVVIGHLKPMILFPLGVINRLSPQEIEAILAHELAHVVRYDFVFNIVQSVVEALFYYHPTVWWLSEQARNEREMACDQFAISLTGDSLSYAKALVTIQEMAWFPLSQSLAFAGQNKGLLKTRIQRIFNVQQNTIFIMEKFAITSVVLLCIIGFAYSQSGPSAPETTPTGNIETTHAEEAPSTAQFEPSGIWEATFEKDQVCMQFSSRKEGWMWSNNDCFAKSEFSALPTEDSEFLLQREAGTMQLQGRFDSKGGYGRFNFTGNADFKSYLEQQGFTKVNDDLMIHLFFTNINKEYVSFLKQNGYNNISKSQLRDLAIHGVNLADLKDYLDIFKKAGYQQVSLNKIVEYGIHGVDREYIQSFEAMGYQNVSLGEILQAKIHGIDGDYVQQIRANGYKDVSLDQVMQMKIHGIDAEFITSMNAASKKTLTPDELINARIHGLKPDDAARISEATGREPSTDMLTNFAMHGVDEEFIAEMNGIFNTKLSNEDLLNAKIHGLSADYVNELQSAGFKNLSFYSVLNYKIHGMTPSFVERFRKAGYTDIQPDDMMNYKIHGLTPEFAQSFVKMGYKDLTLDDALNLKIHGVTTSFIQGFVDIGFKNLDISEVQNAKIHGMTPQFILNAREKGYKDLDMDDYIQMKIQSRLRKSRQPE
jgi:beta-lactamase regulating signal transducer with metallopeptidase domain